LIVLIDKGWNLGHRGDQAVLWPKNNVQRPHRHAASIVMTDLRCSHAIGKIGRSRANEAAQRAGRASSG